MTSEQNDSNRTRELIRRLIVEGPDRIAFHVYRRVSADRVPAGTLLPIKALSWPEIAEWAQLEGLLDAEQARLLCQAPARTPAREDEDTDAKEPPDPQPDAEQAKGAP